MKDIIWTDNVEVLLCNKLLIDRYVACWEAVCQCRAAGSGGYVWAETYELQEYFCQCEGNECY